MMRCLNVKEDGIYVIRIRTTYFKVLRDLLNAPQHQVARLGSLRPWRIITMAAPNNNYKFYKS